jgi:hypothetical protein
VEDTAPAGMAPKSDSARVPGSAAPASSSVATTSVDPKAKAEPKSFGSFTLEDLKTQVPQSDEGDFQLEVPELYYTAGDLEVQKVLTGQPVVTKAQVLPEKVNNAEGRRMRMFRLLVQCCAADAKPYSVPIEFKEKAPDMPDMSWVEIKGTMDYVKENGQTVPLMHVTSYKEITAPDEPNLY